MFIITSAKKNIIATSGTNNSVDFHNKLFDTDDCVIEFVKDPTPEEIENQKINIKIQVEKSKEIQELRSFLSSTDYKIVRQLEQMTMPVEEYSELLIQRQNARNKINELETSL